MVAKGNEYCCKSGFVAHGASQKRSGTVVNEPRQPELREKDGRGTKGAGGRWVNASAAVGAFCRAGLTFQASPT